MTRRELQHVEEGVTRITNQDGHVAHALAMVRKDLAAYDARRGQLRDQYDYDASPW